ncbi:MAG TPA: Hsp70 family protein [Candidatus Limnocylindrales bacterium]|nr:Hsp70 family protein [Candidatus Limnocylindrales bacterium]
MAYSLGIDLGTTYSAAAIARGDRLEIFQLGERAATIPSMVLLRADGEVLTGEAAERRALAEPTRTGREFKRRLGDPTPIILGGTPYGAEALLAHLLRAIVERVSQQLGERPAAIALCHPAAYGAYKLDLLQQAVRQADIGDVTLLTEPEAAALDYARQERVPSGSVFAIYDFGGGTFDATILRKTDAGFEALGQPEGLERLGGIDFDEALFRRALEVVAAAGVTVDPNDPATMAAIARLRDECRRGKEALSSDTDATVPIFLPGIQTEMRVTRAEFEDMIRPRIHETIAALGRATRSAGLEYADIDRILLVGGSSRIPLVAEMVREASGRPVAVDAHPKHTMAMGAAYVAEQLRAATSPAPAAAGVALAAPTADLPQELATEDTVAGPVEPSPQRDQERVTANRIATAPPSDGSVRTRRAVPVGLALVAALVVAAVAIGANMLGGSGGGGVASPSVQPSVAVVASPSPSPSPTLSPSPTPIPTPTPTPEPTPTPTPSGRFANIKGITISGGRYVVDYEVGQIVQDNNPHNGFHVHFFFNTVKPQNAGSPQKGPWELYDGPIPFKVYKVSDKPRAATKMCILVARRDHSVIQDTGNCVALPS